MARPHRFASPVLRYAYDRYVGTSPVRQAAFERELLNAEVAMELYRLRTEAGLTQAALARLVRTTPSVISRLEDADYAGHSLSMLHRIACALNCRIQIHFVPTAFPEARRKRSKRPAA